MAHAQVRSRQGRRKGKATLNETARTAWERLFCIQLSGVRLIGSKVLKNTSENSLCLPVFPISPVEHSVHLKNSCCLAYQTSPAPVISKSRVIEFIQWLVQERVWGDKSHTIEQEKNVRYIRHDVGYDIGYDIVCDIRYDMMLF